MLGYIALRPIKLAILDGAGIQTGVRIIEPGQFIEDVDTWSYPTIIAHLNLGLMRWSGEDAPPHTKHRFNVIDIRAYQEAGRQSSSGQKPAEGPSGGANLAAPSEHSCPHCPKTFGNSGARSNHIKAKHPNVGEAG